MNLLHPCFPFGKPRQNYDNFLRSTLLGLAKKIPYQSFLLNLVSVRTHNTSMNPKQDERIAKMTFASVYPHYVTKVEKKSRTKEELHQVIEWLTGYDEKQLQQQIEEKATFESFFANAKLNPNAHLIKGVICGYRVEEIENPLTQKARYLDKLVDELAKGKAMEKILRKPA